MFTRRRFIERSALVGAGLMAGALPRFASAQSWRQGGLAHLLPLASHDRLLINASFREPLDRPRLRIGRRVVDGERRDTIGRFWQFHGDGLEAATEYELRLESSPGQSLTDAWPLRTTPAPDAMPEQVRLMIYTCAGGFEGLQRPNGRGVFHSLAVPAPPPWRAGLVSSRTWSWVSATRCIGIGALAPVARRPSVVNSGRDRTASTAASIPICRSWARQTNPC